MSSEKWKGRNKLQVSDFSSERVCRSLFLRDVVVGLRVTLREEGDQRRKMGTGLGRRVLRERKGMTLLELTVVILVLLSLVAVLFIGGRAWKRGSDQALCVLNIRNVQQAVRSYANIYGYSPGDHVEGLKSKIIGFGKFVEEIPECPAGGVYTYGEDFGEDTIPPIGTVYLRCSLAEEGHEMQDTANW